MNAVEPEDDQPNLWSAAGRPCLRCGHARRSHRYWRTASAAVVCRVAGCHCASYEAFCSHRHTTFTERDSVYCLDCRADIAVADG